MKRFITRRQALQDAAVGFGAMAANSILQQERLFAAAVNDGVIANALAIYLHDHHPRTAHPPKPTALV